MTGIALSARAAALACAVLPLPLAGAWAAGDVVAEAKAAVAKFAGPQTAWEGPTSGPKAEPGKKIVYVSGDENNDICRLYGVFQKEAGQQIGWDVTIIDGKGDLFVACYEPSRILRLDRSGNVEVYVEDPTAHTLCHPTNIAFDGPLLYAANLGRWHISRVETNTKGRPLWAWARPRPVSLPG